MPGLDGTRDGMAVARLKKLQAILQDSAKLTVLNALLALDTDSSYLIDSAHGGAITSSMVKIGDIDPLQWDLSTGSLRICVCAGDYHQGVDFTNNLEFITEGGTTKTFNTSIFAYFHFDAWRQTDTDIEAQSREIARARVQDWLMWVLEYFATPTNTNLLLTLSSHYYDAAGDQLSHCYARQGIKGMFSRGYGDSLTLYGIHILHQGTLQGSMI